MKIYEICVSLGFFDQGRFSRDYQLMFGELPSTTLKRKRIV